MSGKNLVVIGGTTGIGLSGALALVRAGANVVVTGRNPESCLKAQQQLGRQGLALEGDATWENAAEDAIDLCLNSFGPLHGIYHVAGGSGRKFGDGPLHTLTLEGWQNTLDLNITSLMLSNRAAVRTFLRQGQGGVILNMSSVLGYSPSSRYFGTHAYAAAKSAVFGFSKSIAAYYARENIRINVLAPALVQTPMSQRASEDPDIGKFILSKQPLDGGRIGKSEDYDGAVVYLLSDESSFMTGQIVTVDGGWTISEGQYQ